MNHSVIDVYYVPCGVVGFCPSFADVQRSWDGSLYIETNVIAFAGESQRVSWTADGIIFIDGQLVNGGLNDIELFRLNAG